MWTAARAWNRPAQAAATMIRRVGNRRSTALGNDTDVIRISTLVHTFPQASGAENRGIMRTQITPVEKNVDTIGTNDIGLWTNPGEAVQKGSGAVVGNPRDTHTPNGEDPPPDPQEDRHGPWARTGSPQNPHVLTLLLTSGTSLRRATSRPLRTGRTPHVPFLPAQPHP